MYSTEIAIKRKIEEVISIRNECIKIYKGILDSMNAIGNNLKTIGSYLEPSQRSLLGIEDYAKELDKKLWTHCFDKLGVFTVMNSRNIDSLRNEIEKNHPKFTEKNVEATIQKLYENRQKYFVEGIIETFRGLSRNHKTNTNEKFKIPDKCVIRHLVESNWSGGLRLNYYIDDKISDIDRTFCVLDKQPFEQRKTICEVNDKLKNNETYENNYFELQGYKNGNTHIRFKRIDLLDLANQLIAEYYGNSLK